MLGRYGALVIGLGNSFCTLLIRFSPRWRLCFLNFGSIKEWNRKSLPLPKGTRMRTLHTKRYQKQVQGHHIQADVKFVTFKGKHGEKVRRFQYTAIDDATRVRALKIYEKHTQANAIDFIDHMIEKFPFRIREVRTDNGHEFEAKFHWHVEDIGIRHAYIKRGSAQFNGKVERSHRSDQQEF